MKDIQTRLRIPISYISERPWGSLFDMEESTVIAKRISFIIIFHIPPLLYGLLFHRLVDVRPTTH